ncbi:hypothetical protein DCCM_0783 [Desulfocucumis palustris]|uniref:Spore coat protein n=1 Tax=Desulfocucumis palustris TaxID=1898651 RepID=A0A2L2X8N6_9FIRM|nr:spore coat protein [Desulfocucumis palustris]GBF32587.1 hypothetical protein DCCM_0783 [Desulfocucumis palustris]
MNLGDREILTDLLLGAKHISTCYHHAILEAASDRSRNVLMQLHNDELNTHRQIFELMYTRGYYQVEPARAAAAGTYATSVGMGMGQQAGMAAQQMISPGMAGQNYYGMQGQNIPGMPGTYGATGR